MEHLVSRFFTQEDDRRSTFVFDLPDCWWSRGYEYEWASRFTDVEATVLDAACGLEHPLKYHLAETCRACHACDADARLLSDHEFSAALRATYGDVSTQQIEHRRTASIHYTVASMTDFPYPDATFDRVFCISVLEHLKDRFNKWPLLRCMRLLLPFARQDISDALCELRRVLAPDGLIVLTFDYPRISLSYLEDVIRRAGLRFAADVDFLVPENPLYSDRHQLCCFRAVLCHDRPPATSQQKNVDARSRHEILTS